MRYSTSPKIGYIAVIYTCMIVGLLAVHLLYDITGAFFSVQTSPDFYDRAQWERRFQDALQKGLIPREARWYQTLER
ncbi:MAG: hypothetical protein JW844_02690 [Candidatus Omnitrophica bacterium]|nr:hypothetical protein [Candidatus Omnitrophota bacterium]